MTRSLKKSRGAGRVANERKPGAHSQSNAVLKNHLIKGTFLFLIPLLLYLPSTRGQFVWDDDTHVTTNIITEPNGLYRTLFTTEQPNYWPVTWTAAWAQWKLFGMNPAGYHWVNIVLHSANSVLVWLVVSALALPGAWIAGLVFAVHPVNVECAAWITQLKSLLAMLFALLSLLAYIRSGESGKRHYLLALGLFVVALLSKPSVVTLPAVLVIIAWWKDRLNKAELTRILPFFAAAGVMSLLEIWFQNFRSIQHTEIRTDGLLSRLAGSGWVFWFYAMKVLAPVKLMFVYPRWTFNTGNILTWIPLAGLVAAIAVTVSLHRRWGRGPAAAIVAYAVTLLPVMGFLNIFYMRYSFVADHWQYQSMPILVVLVVSGIYVIADKLSSGATLRNAAFAVIAIALAGLSFVHQKEFKDPITLWNATLTKNPDAWLARQSLGVLYMEHGRLDGALREFDEVLRIKPNFPEAFFNKGVALASAGQLDAAVQQYREALKYDPKYVEAHNNLGHIYAQQQKPEPAMQHYQKALELSPSFAEAHVNMGLLHAGQGQFAAAEASYRKALEVKPGFTDALINLGAAYLQTNRLDQAETTFREVIRQRPDYPEAYVNLANVLRRQQQFAPAAAQYEKAVELRPGYVKARFQLGTLYAEMGRQDLARGQFEEVLRIDPGFQPAQAELSRLRK